MAYFEQIQANIPDSNTFFSGQISAVGAGTQIDTTGYQFVVIEIAPYSSTAQGFSINIEGSNDGTYWETLTVFPLNNLMIKDKIDIIGNYGFEVSTRYIRYNVQQLTGTITAVILGRSGAGPSPADRITVAMDSSSNTPLYVSLNGGIKVDPSTALIQSDSPGVISIGDLAVGTPLFIDTQGYQTIQITTGTTFASTTGVAASTDNITYTNNIVGTTSVGAFASTLVASTNYTFPCIARYLKIVATTAGSLTYTLRNNIQQTNQNLSAIAGAAISSTTAQLGLNVVNYGGSAVVTGGVAGMPAVGGNIAAGTAPTSNPVPIGSVDVTGLTRRIVSDIAGHLLQTVYQPVLPSGSGSVATSNTSIPYVTGSFINQIPLTVQETSQTDGLSITHLLAQLVTELKVVNQQIYELPAVIAAALVGPTTPSYGPNVQYGDPPEVLRQDPQHIYQFQQ
jgi:hypothetical protein